MDAIVRIQLAPEREGSAQEYANKLREDLRTARSGSPTWKFSFNTGGLMRGALNEGKSTPVSIRVTGKDLAKPAQIAAMIRERVAKINGVVDAVIVQRQNYPEYVINVDRTKAADLGMTQIDVMQNVVASLNSSISFNKRNFWIDPKSHNQYFVGVQYPEKDITSIETMLDVPITGRLKAAPVAAPDAGDHHPDHRPDRDHPQQPRDRRWTSPSGWKGVTSATSPTTSRWR